MEKTKREKYEMFGRISKFGIANRVAFPEESAVGKKFSQMAAEVKIIADQLVRLAVVRAEARKIKLGTRQTAMTFMKAVASAGRRAAIGEVTRHPFRMPARRSATMVLTTARMFVVEADRRKERFAELGLPPSFLADFAKAVDDLATAVEMQQGSRSARSEAQGTIDAALARGMAIVADLDVTVPAILRDDPGRLAGWAGARRMEQPGDARAGAPAAETATPPAATIAPDVPVPTTAPEAATPAIVPAPTPPVAA